ncbi:MAG: PQQ-dependent sugar dehydrogenase [Myxococcota bacterium]
MSASPTLGWPRFVGLALAFAACGGVDAAPTDDTTASDSAAPIDDAVTADSVADSAVPIDDTVTADGVADSAEPVDTSAPDVGPPVGLDERPSNPTCVAFGRPPVASGGEIAFEPAFPNMDFGGNAIGLRRLRVGPDGALRWFVLDRTGLVWTFVAATASKDGLAADGTTPVEKAEVFLDLPEDVYGTGGEGGLLGFAFDPDFDRTADANFVYVHYTTYPHNNVWRFRVARVGDAWSVVESKRIFDTASGGSNHWGGDLQFGPDGYLYISLGDGGNGMDAADAGNLARLRGKILRIDPRSAGAAEPYRIPATNPFAGGAPCDQRDLAGNADACPEVFASGFRNPWRMTFDRETGRLWVGDVGSGKEEVDLVLAGRDYGWNVCDGKNGAGCPPGDTTSDKIAPVAQYRHYAQASIAGGFVYRGTALAPELGGAYVFSDVYNGELLVIDKPYQFVTFDPAFAVGNVYEHPDETGDLALPRFRKIAGPQLTSPVSWAEDEHGELYAVTFGAGRGQGVFVLVRAGVDVVDTAPALLSQTGCVDASDPTKPAPGLIPYDLNAPFWSDGALKQRWLALPDGATIKVRDDGDYDLPVGSVVMKRFELAGAIIETRLMVRHADGGWAGYSWVWRADQSDADRADPGGETRVYGAQVWKYPSRAACLNCHTIPAGGTLGLETRQLNRTLHYAATDRDANQIDTLAHLGLYTVAPAPASTLPGAALVR